VQRLGVIFFSPPLPELTVDFENTILHAVFESGHKPIL